MNNLIIKLIDKKTGKPVTAPHYEYQFVKDEDGKELEFKTLKQVGTTDKYVEIEYNPTIHDLQIIHETKEGDEDITTYN